MRLVTQGRERLIELHMAEGQVAEEVGLHLLGVLSRPCQPETNRHLGMPPERLSIGDRQTKIDGEQDLRCLCRRRAKTIQRGPQTTGKTFPAGLTAEPLNPVSASFAIAHQGVEGRIGVAVIIAVWVGARMPRRANRLGLARTLFRSRHRSSPPCVGCPTVVSDGVARTPGNRAACVA